MSSLTSRRRVLLQSLGLGATFSAGWASSHLSIWPTVAAAQVTANPQKKAESLGIVFEKQQPGFLNKCVRSGNLLITSGHTSKIRGKLGADLTVEQGAAAAKECAIEILRSVWDAHGTLDGLRVLKVLGCVNCTPDFVDQPRVINGCSELLHDIFGATTDGWHARSALGFASLPSGVAVEIEAIFEVKN